MHKGGADTDRQRQDLYEGGAGVGAAVQAQADRGAGRAQQDPLHLLYRLVKEWSKSGQRVVKWWSHEGRLSKSGRTVIQIVVK